MEVITVVFTINNRYVTPTYIAIKSLFDNAYKETVYECIILSADITHKNMEILSSLTRSTKHTIRHIKVDDKTILIGAVSHMWPKEVYYRLYICDILRTYDKVIFSDADVFFCGDLTEIWHEGREKEEVEIAAVAVERNDERAIIHKYYPENTHEYIYMAGFMYMNLRLMRNSNWSNRCRENIKLFKDRLYMCDLEIINLTAKEIKPLPLRYVLLQSLYDTDDIKDASDYQLLKGIYSEDYMINEKEKTVIVHYAGNRGKPWLRKDVPDYYALYLKKLPFWLKWQNNIQRIYVNVRKKLAHIYRCLRY